MVKHRRNRMMLTPTTPGAALSRICGAKGDRFDAKVGGGGIDWKLIRGQWPGSANCRWSRVNRTLSRLS